MKKRQMWRCIGLFALALLSCSSGGEQHNDHPLLASNGGGTAGGAINGKLEVLVFSDNTLFPYVGAVVSLGDSGKQTQTTDNQGIALFTDVHGPQDIHVFACDGCDSDPNNPATPLLYQIASFYQVNASQVAIPVVPRIPSFASGTMQGKVFEVARDETAYTAAIDEFGKFQIIGPLRSTTYQVVNDESPSPTDLMFVFTRDIDDWAAADPAGAKQGFGTTAVVGRAINGSKQPQGGVRVTARYFQGSDAGRAYYFNEAGQIDPGLNATTSNGRFLFLHLEPGNDLMLSAENPGIGVGARFVHLLPQGTMVLSLPLLPLEARSVDLSGRVVNYRLDFREEERKGPLSSQNGGVESAVINFSGDTLAQSLVADSGPQIAGNYRSQQHLIANGRYIVAILSTRNFRPTLQELQMNDRSKFKYPLAAVAVNDLVDMVRAKKGSDTSGLTVNTGEILGRVVAPTPTGEVDANGDPIMTPVSGAKITITDSSGKKISTLAYFDQNSVISPTLDQTTATGGFLVFDLTQGVYTVTATATDPTTQKTTMIGRKTLAVYANSTHLVELVNKSGEITLGATEDANLNPTSLPTLSLFGGEIPPAGKPECAPPQQNPLGENCTLPAAGEYIIKMEHPSGGGDYSISVAGSKRALGLSAFRASPDGALNNVFFAGGLGPLSAGGTLNYDLSFVSGVGLVPTEGTITLPPNFTTNDLRAVLVGAVGGRGGVFIGSDATAFSGRSDPTFRALSLQPQGQGALSYFVMAIAQNSKGESSQVHVQGLSDIPQRQDLTLADPPRLVSPAPDEAVVVKVTTEDFPPLQKLDPTFVTVETPSPHLVWAPPAAGPVDFYRVTLETTDGQLLWEAWLPGSQTEITLPAFPQGIGPEDLNPFTFPTPLLKEWKPVTDNRPIRWSVEAIRAGGLSFNEFTFRQLAQQRVSVASAESRFVPRWIRMIGRTEHDPLP